MSMSFEKLEVWKKGCLLTEKVYDKLALSKEYWIRDQMLRAALSIPSNIAEGSERGSVAEFRQFIFIAQGSTAELRTPLNIAHDIGMVDKDTAEELIS